jgi:DNA-directed RNA polymerase subunit L
MNPLVQTIVEDGDTLTFTLSGVNVSLANAIRRTLLSDIPIVVFRTSPHESNKANITINTSRINNEILKQRLSCIPIHITDLQMPLQNYIMEVDKENLTDTIMFVTTEDFKIKNVQTGEYLSKKDVREIFPPCEQTGYYIDFARLRPKISDEIPGERLQLTCEFSIGNSKLDSMFNVVSTCAYGYTTDPAQQEVELAKKVHAWKEKGLDKAAIEFESKDWRLLDGQRVVRPDSFDFIVQTVGIFTNYDLVKKACEIIIMKLEDLDALIDADSLEIVPSANTLNNAYDITLINEDYTIGKVIEYILYSKFFEGVKTLSYCGFKKMHPHDSNSIIRVAYHNVSDKGLVKQNLKECISAALAVYQNIKVKF